MVEQPDWHDEEGKDDGGDDEGHECVDATSSVVLDFGISAFGGSFLIFVRRLANVDMGCYEAYNAIKYDCSQDSSDE